VVLFILPSSASAVSATVVAVSVTGVGFAPGAVLVLDGRFLQTTVVSSTQLTAVVPPGLPPGTYSATVTNPGFASSTPLPNAFTVANLASILYIPSAIKRSGEGSSAIYVQNVSATAPTIIYIRYYNVDGFSDPTWGRSIPVPPGVSVVFDLGLESGLPAGFAGSAVVQADQPIAGVVNQANPFGSTGAGPLEVQTSQPRASAGAYSVSALAPAATAVVPVVFAGYNGYTTTLSIQNTGRAPSTYTVALFPTGSTSPISTIPRAIPPLASARVRLGLENGVPNGFVGTAIVAGPGSTVAVAADTVHGDTNVTFSYGGLVGGANRMYAPLLFKNSNGWVTGAQVVNTSSSNVVVDAALYSRDSSIFFGLPSRTLLPNESYTYYLPAIPEIPEGFVGSGEFSASGPIAVVVQELSAERGAGMAYTGFSGGTPNVSVPVVFKASNNWDSGVQVQNLGSTDAFVTIRYFLPSGAPAVDTANVSARDSYTFYQPGDPNLPSGLTGSAIVTSVNNQPIIAIVNEVNYSRVGDFSMVYEGINY
jgi:hypothetical protein